ncbi:hypothetical protein DYB38_006401 [Aphanomyces astaci]|uniref:RanBP-type and C3HC4-type zinc finger-containing protein 1 n=1 Tax=Aphanomyces astaci TaxID=112090 RepID=A0A397DEJ7_APHAT|nr:hypothetical protein DYB38_006401 [Aphanomyces astaci]
MLAKKLSQMRDCLGDAAVDDEQLKHLLKKNAGSVSFAIASYYDTMARTEAKATKNDSQYWINQMDYSDYYLGVCTVEAHVTRRDDGALRPGARLNLQVEGSMLRIMSLKGIVLGRIDEAWESMVQPLINGKMIKVGANVLDAPAHTTVFSRFQLQVHVFAAPLVWNALHFQETMASATVKEHLFQLMDVLHNKHVVTPTSAMKLPGDTSDKISADADVDALYATAATVESRYESALVHAKLHGITLRSYQDQALQWMLHRELYEDTSSDGKTIGLALRTFERCYTRWKKRCFLIGMNAKQARAHEPEIHPLWDKRECTRGHNQFPTPYYINTFERLVSLQIPPPPRPCLGGILADDMGMGKTIMILALVVARTSVYTADRRSLKTKFHDDDHTGKTKPDSVQGKTLVVCPLSLLHQWKHEFETRAPSLSVLVYYENKKLQSQDLCVCDVVLTTYGVVGSEFEHRSVIHNVSWTRLILDEAHSIKNKTTTYFKACSDITATHRWCLTGTPIQNSLDDMLALLTFLRYEPILLRRTKASRDPVTNQLIVQLPPKSIDIVRLAFSPEERQFYQAVYSKSQGDFYGYVANGTAGASYVAIFALLLRLRQACDHPFLVVGKDTDLSLKKAKPRPATHDGQTKEGYYADLSAAMMQTSSCSQHPPREELYIKNRILEIQDEGLECQECPVCLDVPVAPVLTPCAHLMCHACVVAFLRNGGSNDVAGGGGCCPVCRAPISPDQLIRVDPPDKPTTGDNSPPPDDDDGAAPLWAGSAKLTQLVVDLKSIEAGRKVVVFSQWTHMLDLIQSTLHQHGYTHCRFDGSLKQDDREKVLRRFNTQPDVQVLVISLKAGGVGLNLTAASVVIIMDPWWNPGIEDQAIDRVHRLGQTRDVLVKKYIVEGTVEDMILTLQQRKATLASTVLATSKAGADNDGRLSLADLLTFFA